MLRRALLLVSFSLGLFIFGNVIAEPVSEEAARAMIKGWFRSSNTHLGRKLHKQIDAVETCRNANGETLFYLFKLEPRGFVIVSSDDLIEPVIAFSDTGSFSVNQYNPLLSIVKFDMDKRLNVISMRKKRSGTNIRAQKKWNTLIELSNKEKEIKLGESSISDVRVDALVKSTWAQSTVGSDLEEKACYNYYTPTSSGTWTADNTSNYPAGCLAIAMAQLMRYHQIPSLGVGTDSFTVGVGADKDNLVDETRSLLGGDTQGGAYDWDNMVLSPSSSSTDDVRKAIGALCHDAGVSVKSDYTPNGTGGVIAECATQLVSTFDYYNAIYGMSSSTTTTIEADTLKKMINPNLDCKYPVILGIRVKNVTKTADSADSDAYHAIVCDGYGYSGSTLYYHLNMGWSGSYDLWYTLPAVGTVGSYDYQLVNDCVYNIFGSDMGEIISGIVKDKTGDPVEGLTVQAVDSNDVKTTATTNSEGIYAIIVNSNTEYTLSIPSSELYGEIKAETGKSTSDSETVGNLWEQNFSPSTTYLACGSALQIDAEDVLPDGKKFGKSVKVFVTYQDVIKGTERTVPMKSVLKDSDYWIMEMKKFINLYNPKAVDKTTQKGLYYYQNPIQDLVMDSITLWAVDKKTGLSVIDQSLSGTYYYGAPTITDVVGDITADSTFVVKGTYFGSKLPKVLLEYKVTNKKGDVKYKYKPCKLDKEASSKFLAAKITKKSCMKIYSTDVGDEQVGYSEVTAINPHLKMNEKFVWTSYVLVVTKGGVASYVVSQGYTVSGQVQDSDGNALSGVTMTLSGDADTTTTTASDGTYSFSNLENGTYTVTPSLDGYTFSSTSENVTINDANQTGVDFTGTQGGSDEPTLTITKPTGGETAYTNSEFDISWTYTGDSTDWRTETFYIHVYKEGNETPYYKDGTSLMSDKAATITIWSWDTDDENLGDNFYVEISCQKRDLERIYSKSKYFSVERKTY